MVSNALLIVMNAILRTCIGGPGHSVFASYSAAVFVVGGSGISFGLSTVQELVQRDLEGASRVKVIELIWCVQDHGKSYLQFMCRHLMNQKKRSILNTTAPALYLTHPAEHLHATQDIGILHSRYGEPGHREEQHPRSHVESEPTQIRQDVGRSHFTRCVVGLRRKRCGGHNRCHRRCLRATYARR